MSDVQGHLRETAESCVNPGDFFFQDLGGGRLHLGFVCPCGCGDWTGFIVREDGEHKPPAWGWNRNREKPTCTPSLKRLDRCEWHGFLTDGVFKRA